MNTTATLSYYNESLGAHYGRRFRRSATGGLESQMVGNAYDREGDWLPCPASRVRDTMRWMQERGWSKNDLVRKLREAGIHGF